MSNLFTACGWTAFERAARVHHRDVVAVALRDFEARLEGSERESLLARMRIQTEGQDRRPA
jgi:hypothetical protein